MTSRSLFALIMTLAVVAAGCNPSGAQESQQPTETRPKVLTFAVDPEPTMMVAGIGTRVADYGIRDAVHQRMVIYNERGELTPQLATELPSVERGTWVVRPDGTMQTTWHIRPGVTWHDGTPLTMRDFVFAWTVMRDPNLPIEGGAGGAMAQLIERIDTPDEQTLVLEWKQVYAEAAAQVQDDLGPLPAHLLEAEYRGDSQRFQNLSYWSRGFVGVGPYRLAEWEPGSHMVVRAYDGFYRGRPAIDTVVFRFMPNDEAVVAAYLAGALNGSQGLGFQQANFARQELESRGVRPTVFTQAASFQVMVVQGRDSRPRELTDNRVRRALLYASDRQSIADAIYDGRGQVAHAWVQPQDALWDRVKDSATIYSFDQRRAEELLTAAGWRRVGGRFVTASGEPATIPVWTTGGAEAEQESAIMNNQWKNFGLEVEQTFLSEAQARDGRYRATFPGLLTNSAPRITLENIARRYATQDCPSDANRFTGLNRGCYANPRVDTIIQQVRGAFQPTEREALVREWVRIYTDELPDLPQYWSVTMTLFDQAIVGIKPRAGPVTSSFWNISEWDMR